MGTLRFWPANILIIVAIMAVLAFSVYAYLPNSSAHGAAVEFAAGRVLPGGSSNTVTTTIPVTTSTIPPTNAIGSNIPGAPKISINITYTKAYTVVLRGSIRPGTNGTTINAINVSWGDNSWAYDATLPINHTYKSTGSFLITVTAFQTNKQTNAAVISALVRNTTNSTTTSASTTVLPASTSVITSVSTTVAPTTVVQQSVSSGSNNTLLYVVGIVVLIIIVAVAYFAFKGRGGKPMEKKKMAENQKQQPAEQKKAQ